MGPDQGAQRLGGGEGDEEIGGWHLFGQVWQVFSL